MYSSIKRYFPDYEGDDQDFSAARNFFRARFCKMNRSATKEIYPSFTNATDTSLLKIVMASVTDIILTNSLRESEFFRTSFAQHLTTRAKEAWPLQISSEPASFHYHSCFFITSHFVSRIVHIIFRLLSSFHIVSSLSSSAFILYCDYPSTVLFWTRSNQIPCSIFSRSAHRPFHFLV